MANRGATSAGIARMPFLLTVAPRACSCTLPPKELGRFGKLDRALAAADGYWCVYLAFFGDQVIWLDWLIVDMRDGVMMWRNGRPTKRSEHGQKLDSDNG